jgi:hypothetical protein
MNIELKRILKKIVNGKLQLLSDYLLEWTEEKHEEPLDVWYRDRGSNPTPLKYKSQEPPLLQTFWVRRQYSFAVTALTNSNFEYLLHKLNNFRCKQSPSEIHNNKKLGRDVR